MNNRPEEMYCPVCDEIIDCETCYELVMCLDGLFKVESIPDVEIVDREEAAMICAQCKYSQID